MVASIIIAVDPGTIDTGVVVLRNSVLIHTAKLHVPPKRPLGERVFMLLLSLTNETVGSYPLGSDVDLVYERPIIMHGTKRFGGTQARDLRSLHELVGALEYWGRLRDFRVVGYEVGDIKEGVGGGRMASKEEVEANLRLVWNLSHLAQEPASNHEWDALSVAHFHLSQKDLQTREIKGDPRGRQQ